MSQTASNLVVHMVFSTKARRPLITPETRSDVFAYLGGIIREMDGTALIVGGMSDHVHLLIRLRPVHAVAEIGRVLKANSSRWIREKWNRKFAWQNGYGAFSVSESNVSGGYAVYRQPGRASQEGDVPAGICRFFEEEQDCLRRAVHLGVVSIAPAGLAFILDTLPRACALGCILAPLRGWNVECEVLKSARLGHRRRAKSQLPDVLLSGNSIVGTVSRYTRLSTAWPAARSLCTSDSK